MSLCAISPREVLVLRPFVRCWFSPGHFHCIRYGFCSSPACIDDCPGTRPYAILFHSVAGKIQRFPCFHDISGRHAVRLHYLDGCILASASSDAYPPCCDWGCYCCDMVGQCLGYNWQHSMEHCPRNSKLAERQRYFIACHFQGFDAREGHPRQWSTEWFGRTDCFPWQHKHGKPWNRFGSWFFLDHSDIP